MAGNTSNIGFEKQIWDAACVLRGNIDASEYKSVVLGLIFLKYISDRFEAKYKELVEEGDGFEEDQDEYTAENIFFVPENARWSAIAAAAHTPEIGTVIDDAMRSIEKENKRLKDILPKNFARPELDKRRLGAVVTVLLYARQFSSPLEQIAEVMGSLQRTCAAAGRVYEMLDAPEEPPIDGHLPQEIRGDVEFRQVNFSYEPETPLIRDFSVSVDHGQKVAIVGPTGAGKTTLVNLLMRFYDIQSGSILIDGCDIAKVSREDVRELFGMVLQDTWLFGGTVAENVAYGKPEATREEIIAACDEAYCDHFIRTLPQGYDTVISEDSVTISGGQKQLLTIARALLANRRLLILDEATSNVDTRTEILIQKAMDKLMRGRTCFVIAHRLSTIVDADRILVINDGQIVETGTHRSLLEQKGFYYRLYTSQYAV